MRSFDFAQDDISNAQDDSNGPQDCSGTQNPQEELTAVLR